MGVALRLARHGTKRKPYYRIVATPKGTKRDGRFLEIVGSYDPNQNPAKIILKDDKVKKWLSQGAMPTQIVRTILVKNLPGIIEERENNKRQKVQSRRKLRKAKNPKKSAGDKASSKKSAKKASKKAAAAKA